jgi:hypothetical protein
VVDEELDGTDVVRQLLGERQRVAHQTRNALSQGVVEAFDVIRFAVLLRNGFVLGWWNHTLVDLIAICVAHDITHVARMCMLTSGILMAVQAFVSARPTRTYVAGTSYVEDTVGGEIVEEIETPELPEVFALFGAILDPHDRSQRLGDCLQSFQT